MMPVTLWEQRTGYGHWRGFWARGAHNGLIWTKSVPAHGPPLGMARWLWAPLGGNTPQIPARESTPPAYFPWRKQPDFKPQKLIPVSVHVGTGAEHAHKHLDMMYGRSGGGDEQWPLRGRGLPVRQCTAATTGSRCQWTRKQH